MKRIDLIVAIAAAVALASCGDPDPNSATSRAYQDPAESPRYADADRNGRVTRDEADVDPALAANFDRYDRNGNGELDRAEFARLEAGSTASHATKAEEEHHTLRPRREFPRPLD